MVSMTSERKLPVPRIPDDPARPFAETVSLKSGSFDNQDTVLSEDQPYEAGTAARFENQSPGVTGYSELISLSEKSVLLINDYKSDKARWVKSTMQDYVSFVFRLEGDSYEFYNDSDPIERSRLECSIVRHVDGMERSTWVPAENHVRTVGMYYDPIELRNILGYGTTDMTEEMHQFIARRSNAYALMSLPCTIDMQRAALSLFNTPFRGRMRTAFAQARATELVCWSLKALVDQKTSNPPPVKLSDRDLDCLQQAREVLLSDLKEPPTISALSRKVGINRNKLSYGFKYIYGECVSEFCQNQRMESAWTLLVQDRLTISQIADEVGYSHPQNFSTAFRQHFGLKPKDVRRG